MIETRIRPGSYVAAVIERPNGQREQTGWFREIGAATSMLGWAIDYRTKRNGGRCIYLLRAIVPAKPVDRSDAPP